MSGTALPTAGRLRFVASDRTGRPWITLFALRGVHQTGSGSVQKNHPALASRVEAAASEFMKRSQSAVASATQQTVVAAGPLFVDAKSVVERIGADAFEYANRASIQLSEAIQAK